MIGHVHESWDVVKKMRDKPLVTTATGGTAPEWLEVVLWRYEVLRTSGYPQEEAMDLSGNRDVDLHGACDLLAAGCPPELATKILR